MTTEEKLYLAGYLDSSICNISMGGKASGKKTKCRATIPTGKKPDFTKYINSMVEGVVALTNSDKNYQIRLNKKKVVEFYQEIGPYIKVHREKIKELQSYTQTIRNHPKAVKMDSVEFIDHENELPYLLGRLDRSCSLGIFFISKKRETKTKVSGELHEVNKSERYNSQVSIGDDDGYCAAHLKHIGLKLNSFNALHPANNKVYSRLTVSGNSTKPFLEWYLKHTKKEENKCTINAMLSEEITREIYEDSLQCKEFVLDDSILDNNLNGDQLHSQRINNKALERKEKKLEIRRKLLKNSEEDRNKLLESKKKGLRSELNEVTKKFLLIKNEYDKIKSKWEEINTDYKVCIGTQEKLHKDEFNIDKTSWDGLCQYSIHHQKDLRSNRYAAAQKQSNDKRRENPLQRLSDSMSTQIRLFLSRGGKSKDGTSWVKLVGYTPQELIEHLMNHPSWERGMTKENYGEWAVDHIKPKAKFNFHDEIDFLKCWSLQNLQPLWYSKNSQKSDYYIEEENKEHEAILAKIKK